jgi:hypothetical protein
MAEAKKVSTTIPVDMWKRSAPAAVHAERVEHGGYTLAELD